MIYLTKKNKPFVNYAPLGNMLGVNNKPLLYKRSKVEIKDSAKTIKYKIAFVKVYKNVSTKDLSLQRKYALNLITDFLNIKEQFLTVRQHKKTEDILHTDRVYYIRKGKKLLGKCSIREQRTFTQTNLIIIFRYRIRISGNKVRSLTNESKDQKKG